MPTILKTSWTILCLALLTTALPSSAAPGPAWADSKLPVRQGLEFWADASSQPAAWKTHGRPDLIHESTFDVFYDGSGHDRHLKQRASSSQPKFISADNLGLIRFDGADDYLTYSGPGLSLTNMTVFVVAAPYANEGGYSGFLSFNETGKNDYLTGFNLDQGSGSSSSFEVLNPEGRGFGGAMDLLPGSFAFRQTHVIEARAGWDSRNVQLHVDGQPVGERPWTGAPLDLDDLTLGARYFSNSAEPPAAGGFFNGHIAELLLYSRPLTDPETVQVRAYLNGKYRNLDNALVKTRQGHRLQTVENPPPVQMLLPGFTVKEMPLELNNINALHYRPDGKLVALGYNGMIHLLSDTDNDGVEDKSTVFWESSSTPTPISMALTPPGYARGQGVFVTTRGKVVLILDTDGDDRGDREEMVGTDWRMPDVVGGGGIVEVLGLAVAPDGSVYFGLGTDNYANAYRINRATGQAGYQLESERGTIQRVSPDFTTRETVCTGIRYPVGLAFNAEGDLFCADQEGATWLPNGNPFDELLHIQAGRHYGFPPRHPRHLPNVIDEPSVYNYGPQHQSTCGLLFNLPVAGGSVFGPERWHGSAIVAGESRGKLYRTQLVKTAAGYVARNEILACLHHLIIDAAVSPAGELAITAHGGAPDWGTGPGGLGKLFKISYTDQEHPQPVLAWAEADNEVRVAFDRPIPPAFLAGLQENTRIVHGQNVRAGDPFETMRPGYEVVRRQMVEPRFDLEILNARITPDRRNLVFTTARQSVTEPHAITLPGMGRPPRSQPGSVPQHARIDLDYDLAGVQASWQSSQDDAAWTGWLPHLETKVARTLTAGSSAHETLWDHVDRPGNMHLRGHLDLQNMLRPAVQRGSSLDYEWPDETVYLTFQSSTPLTVHPSTSSRVVLRRNSATETVMQVNPTSDEWIPFHLEIVTGPRSNLRVAWHTEEDARPRALPLNRILMPWTAPEDGPVSEASPRTLAPELAGGNWGKGRRIFFSEESLCSKCHMVNGQGTAVGPDLSNLVHRDYASVLRDIQDPSAALNPDHLAFEINLTDGESLIGTVGEVDKATYLIAQGPGVQTRLAKSQVESMRPLEKSIMPPGLDELLGPEKMRDLLTFLLTPPPRMPVYGPLTPPAARSRTEVQALLAGSQAIPGEQRRRHLVLVSGKKDHGPGEHDYPGWQNAWNQLLSAAENIQVSLAMDWPSPEQLQSADALIFYQRGDWNDQRERDLNQFMARGGGVSIIHWAVEAGENAEACAGILGLGSNSAKTRYRHGHLDLNFNTAEFGDHPILRNFSSVHFHDETYWNLIRGSKPMSILATAVEEGKPRPQIWTREHGRGRIFGSILGHYAWSFDDPMFRILLLRGIAWSMREPVDRFNDLATIGTLWKN